MLFVKDPSERVLSHKNMKLKYLANDFTLCVFSRGPKNLADVMISDGYEVDILTDLYDHHFILSQHAPLRRNHWEME